MYTHTYRYIYLHKGVHTYAYTYTHAYIHTFTCTLKNGIPSGIFLKHGLKRRFNVKYTSEQILL